MFNCINILRTYWNFPLIDVWITRLLNEHFILYRSGVELPLLINDIVVAPSTLSEAKLSNDLF